MNSSSSIQEKWKTGVVEAIVQNNPSRAAKLLQKAIQSEKIGKQDEVEVEELFSAIVFLSCAKEGEL
jgi:hypothetical protein